MASAAAAMDSQEVAEMEDELREIESYHAILTTELDICQKQHEAAQAAWERIQSRKRNTMDQVSARIHTLSEVLKVGRAADEERKRRRTSLGSSTSAPSHTNQETHCPDEVELRRLQTGSKNQLCGVDHGAHKASPVYYLQAAAFQGCLPCTRYYVEIKQVRADEKGDSGLYDALGWATWKSPKGKQFDTADVVKYLKIATRYQMANKSMEPTPEDQVS